MPSTTTGGSSVSIQGDNSTALATVEGTTVDGDIVLAGPINMIPSDKSTAAGANLIDMEGNLNGNLILNNGSSLINVGSGARGVTVLGPIGACDATALATVNQTCSATDVGTLVNEGGIQVTGTQTPNTKGGNVESGSAVVIGNSIFGGFVNEGPQTANGNVAGAIISGNGATLNNVATPVFLIDPGQTITATNGVVRGPAILGPVQLLVDPADGVTGQTSGYSFINHGSISAAPLDTDTSSLTMLIQGSSPTNYTCFGAPAASVAAGSCVTKATTGGVTTTVGGLLNTGTIAAQAITAENTTSSVSAVALEIGSYATIPRIVVSGELTSGTTTTPGNIIAQVSGPGGGSAAAIIIANLATVPEIDVLQRGTIEAAIATSTVSPTSDFATAKAPFSQSTVAIADQSGTLTLINNAGTIAALNTVQTPGAGAVVGNSSHAIDMLANTLGGITINNSGTIEGDVYFGSAGNNDTLNVGNVGASGVANPATGLTNTPNAYASVSQRIDSNNSGSAPTTEITTISFGSGTNQTLHVGGFGFVNSVILAQAGALNVTVDPNGQLFVANTATTGSLYANNFNITGGILGLNITQGTSSSTPVVQANTASISSTARIGLQFGGFISSGTTLASVSNPTPQIITLISASSLSIAPATLNADNASLATAIPFLFESPSNVEPGSVAPQPLSTGTSGTNQTLLLTLLPRSPGAKNADGTAGLGLSGDAFNMFPYTAKALANDPLLGAAIASNLTVTNGVGTPVLNIAASQQKSQQVFSQFTPDVSGGTRLVAIMLTDQATGPVASRQRLLRSYGNQTGELTLWAEEFAGSINNKGRVDGQATLTAFKDHGWGFAMGMDAGSAKGGWYGGALTYYSGDVSETSPRASITHEQWYMLTGYTDWRGKHVFLDTSLNLGYASLSGNRTLIIGDQNRDAQGKRAALCRFPVASIPARSSIPACCRSPRMSAWMACRCARKAIPRPMAVTVWTWKWHLTTPVRCAALPGLRLQAQYVGVRRFPDAGSAAWLSLRFRQYAGEAQSRFCQHRRPVGAGQCPDLCRSRSGFRHGGGRRQPDGRHRHLVVRRQLRLAARQ